MIFIYVLGIKSIESAILLFDNLPHLLLFI